MYADRTPIQAKLKLSFLTQRLTGETINSLFELFFCTRGWDPREPTQVGMKSPYRKKENPHKREKRAHKVGMMVHTRGKSGMPRDQILGGVTCRVTNQQSDPFLVNSWFELELKSRQDWTLNYSPHEQSWLICNPLPICLWFCTWPIHRGRTSVEHQCSCYREHNT